MKLTQGPFGTATDGKKVQRFDLDNGNGIKASVTDYGCILTSLKMPDRRGKAAEITLGFDTLDEYLADHPYFGAVVGRFANRIARGEFELDGTSYSLARNENGANHLHGGVTGFDKVVWDAEGFEDIASTGVRFHYLSPDGEEGYPGNLDVTVTYALTEDGELRFEYQAETDKPTPINLTNHTYWNLAGAGSGPIFDHELSLNCSHYLPVDEELMPTGEVLPVQGTPMDFTAAKPIGRDFDQVPGGYDHCFVADPSDRAPAPIARVYEPGSSRGMTVSTTKPAVQFYVASFLEETHGAGGTVFDTHGALCLETQFFPDAPNCPEFPSAILRPGETYHHVTVHRFFTG